jgi:colanic acid/amylovoran biosynthesis glycosyltransferase
VVHSHPVWLPQTEPWLYNLVRYLPEPAVLSHVVCDCTENLDQFSVPRLHARRRQAAGRLWSHRLLQPWQARAANRFLATIGRQVGAQLVHSHFGNIGWQDLPAVRQIAARHVVSFYGFEIGRLPKGEPVWLKRYAEMFSTVDLVTCQGPYMAQSVIDLGCPPDKMRIHPLGIETERIPYQPRQWKPGTPLRVLIAASFVEKKGIPSALAALARIKNDVSLAVTIIGDARSERQSQVEKRRILDAISAGSLESCVRLLGFQPHQTMLDEAYRNHIFLSPSVTASDGDTEGGTVLAVIEMVATGMPVVSTRHCDIPALIEHGRTGMLAEEKDVDGIAEGLRWLIKHPDQWQTITDAARKHVDRKYNAAHQGAALADLYAELVSP